MPETGAKIIWKNKPGIFESTGPGKDDCSVLIPQADGKNKREYTKLDQVKDAPKDKDEKASS